MISENVGNRRALAGLQEIEKILAGDDRFFCEVYRCNMLKTACISRQETTAGITQAYKDNKGVSKFYGKPGFSDVNCKNCEQGKEIMKQNTGKSKEEIENSSKNIEALINLICMEEGINLDQIKQRDPTGKLRPVKVRLAQALKEKDLKNNEIADKLNIPRGSINSYIKNVVPKSKKKKQAKSTTKSIPAKPASKSPDIEELTGPKSYAETANPPNHRQVNLEHTLTIDFTDHSNVLERIKEIAKSEIRTPENQVLYWLATYSILIGEEVSA